MEKKKKQRDALYKTDLFIMNFMQFGFVYFFIKHW